MAANVRLEQGVDNSYMITSCNGGRRLNSVRLRCNWERINAMKAIRRTICPWNWYAAEWNGFVLWGQLSIVYIVRDYSTPPSCSFPRCLIWSETLLRCFLFDIGINFILCHQLPENFELHMAVKDKLIHRSRVCLSWRPSPSNWIHSYSDCIPKCPIYFSVFTQSGDVHNFTISKGYWIVKK